MFDVLEIAYHRLRKAMSIEDALRQLLPSSIVAEALLRSKGRQSELIDYLVRERDFDSVALLRAVAERLELGVATELSLPPAALIEKMGYDAETLRKVFVLPQYSRGAPFGYVIVVGDPSLVDIAEYEAGGVDVWLSTSSSIDSVWKERESLLSSQSGEEVSREKMYRVMGQLAEDAQSLGAGEVFVGHPDASHYEFLVEDKRYVGSIHEQLFALLLEEFNGCTEFRRQVASEQPKTLRFALTKNFNNLVVYLSWTDGAEVLEQVEYVAEPLSVDAKTVITSTEEPVTDASPEYEEKSDVLEDDNTRVGILETPSILLVDDDERFSRILKRILEREGYAVNCIGDGQSAIDVLNSNNMPGLIVCDVHMPGVDGGEFLKRLKAMEVNIPVLVVTSDEDELLQVELVELGADAFVRKQEDIRILLAWVRNLLLRETDVAS